jgi:hypothetical protein
MAWRKLYTGIVNRKTLAAAQKFQHHEKLSISLEEKEQDAQELHLGQGDTRGPYPLNLWILQILLGVISLPSYLTSQQQVVRFVLT